MQAKKQLFKAIILQVTKVCQCGGNANCVMSNCTSWKFKSVPLYCNLIATLFTELREFKEEASKNWFQNEVTCDQVEHIT